MGQVSPFLRRAARGYTHWCPACKEMHILPDKGWKFNGNVLSPTFTPSFKHSSNVTAVVDATGKWAGEWIKKPWVCHYVLTAGILNFCGDCTHDMRGQKVGLPVLPAEFHDDWESRPIPV